MPDISTVAHADNRSVSLCSGAVGGAVCNMTCAAGYTREGMLAACVDGQWDVTAVRCALPNGCSTVPDITNVTLSIASLALCAASQNGETCKPTCEVGYSQQGLLRCLAGSWVSDPALACVPDAPGATADQEEEEEGVSTATRAAQAVSTAVLTAGVAAAAGGAAAAGAAVGFSAVSAIGGIQGIAMLSYKTDDADARSQAGIFSPLLFAGTPSLDPLYSVPSSTEEQTGRRAGHRRVLNASGLNPSNASSEVEYMRFFGSDTAKCRSDLVFLVVMCVCMLVFFIMLGTLLYFDNGGLPPTPDYSQRGIQLDAVTGVVLNASLEEQEITEIFSEESIELAAEFSVGIWEGLGAPEEEIIEDTKENLKEARQLKMNQVDYRLIQVRHKPRRERLLYYSIFLAFPICDLSISGLGVTLIYTIEHSGDSAAVQVAWVVVIIFLAGFTVAVAVVLWWAAPQVRQDREERECGPPWVLCQDQQARLYYYNIRTLESQWEKPEDWQDRTDQVQWKSWVERHGLQYLVYNFRMETFLSTYFPVIAIAQVLIDACCTSLVWAKDNPVDSALGIAISQTLECVLWVCGRPLRDESRSQRGAEYWGFSIGFALLSVAQWLLYVDSKNETSDEGLVKAWLYLSFCAVLSLPMIVLIDARVPPKSSEGTKLATSPSASPYRCHEDVMRSLGRFPASHGSAAAATTSKDSAGEVANEFDDKDKQELSVASKDDGAHESAVISRIDGTHINHESAVGENITKISTEEGPNALDEQKTRLESERNYGLVETKIQI